MERPLGYRQVVRLQFMPAMEPILATIRGIHSYGDVYKYDLDLWLSDGTADDEGYADLDTGIKKLQKRSRIYNVDESFCIPS